MNIQNQAKLAANVLNEFDPVTQPIDVRIHQLSLLVAPNGDGAVPFRGLRNYLHAVCPSQPEGVVTEFVKQVKAQIGTLRRYQQIFQQNDEIMSWFDYLGFSCGDLLSLDEEELEIWINHVGDITRLVNQGAMPVRIMKLDPEYRKAFFRQSADLSLLSVQQIAYLGIDPEFYEGQSREDYENVLDMVEDCINIGFKWNDLLSLEDDEFTLWVNKLDQIEDIINVYCDADHFMTFTPEFRKHLIHNYRLPK